MKIPDLILRFLLFAVISGFQVWGDFYDPIVNDREKLYAYVDSIETALGTPVFESLPYDRVLRLAATMGLIDREAVSPNAFLLHLQHVGTVENRFYREEPLTDQDVQAYLMPLRIRYEASSRPEWRQRLAVQFKVIATPATTADACACGVLGWVAKNLRLTNLNVAYRLPIRGDLDPLTVLKGGRGTEIDLAIFGVAALRSCGVLARLVWAPALRNEVGGKIWLEYRSEHGAWVPWVPSFGAPTEHRARIRRELGAKIALVMASPDAPVEITGDYVETVKVQIRAGDSTEVALMMIGSDGLMPIRGTSLEYAQNERIAKVGKGPLIVASTSHGRRNFSLLPIDMPATTREITILADDGGLSIEPSKPHTETQQKP